LDAGTYFIRVYNPFFQGQSTPLHFTIEANAPRAGQVHPLSDHDDIRGGTGNDILVGNDHLDRIFGQDGQDAFVAEETEIRDLATNEFRGEPRGDEDILRSQSALRRLDTVLDLATTVPDANLRRRVVGALGIPVTHAWDGQDLIARAVFASDMARLRRLDAGWQNIQKLDGLEYAVNLRELNVSHNLISDLSVLVPGEKEGKAWEGELGLKRIEMLAIDSTLINDAKLAQVGQLTTLLGLSLDNTGVGDLEPLRSLTGLEFLSVDHRPLDGLLQRFAKPNPAAYDSFGWSVAAVAVEGRNVPNVLVGARYDDTRAQDAGAAYLFDGMTGALLRTFTRSYANVADHYGYFVAAVGRNVLIGAPDVEAGDTDSGPLIFMTVNG